MIETPSGQRVRVVIQSRLNSSRLPGKALLDVAGLPLIELVARRAGRTGHEVIVATSEEDYDELIADRLAAVGIPVIRGSLDDVLGRFAAACADLDDDDLVVRLTGDNPLVDGELVAELVEATRASGHRYGRVDIEAVPEGLGAEVFTAGDLRAAAAAASSAYDREHVTPWLRRELGEHLFVPVGSPSDIHAYRATVDTLSDYVRVSRLFRGIDDPVHVAWQELMKRLGVSIRSAGRRAPRKDLTLAGPAGVALEGGVLTDDGADRLQHGGAATRHRELLAYAVDHGVTDIFVDASDDASLRALRGGVVPALVGRLSYNVRVVAAGGPPATEELRARATLERAFALIGQRSARSILAQGPALSEKAWLAIQSYVAEGVATSAGCVVSSPAELHRATELDGVSLIEVNGAFGSWPTKAEHILQEVSGRGVRILIRLPSHTPRGSLKALIDTPWVSAIIVPVRTVGELADTLTAGS